jgi:hypothetical protein
MFKVQDSSVVATQIAGFDCALGVRVYTNFICTVSLRDLVESEQQARVSQSFDPLAAAQNGIKRLAAINHAHAVKVEFGIFGFHLVADGRYTIVKKEKVAVSISINGVPDSLVHRVA